MSTHEKDETYQRVLDVAERFFSARGYAAVRLRDIAEALGVKHSALYYYAPEGKEQLYVRVMERSLHRHRIGMEAALAEASLDLRTQMQAIAAWLLAQPPMNLTRMTDTDFSALRPDNVHKLSTLLFDSLRLPILTALQRAVAAEQVALPDLDLAAISFVTLVEIVHSDTSPGAHEDEEQVVQRIIDMLLYGWLKR